MFLLMSYGILGFMMNEILFLAHVFFVLSVVCGAVLLGRQAVQALVCMYIVFANLFVVKKMLLMGFIASGSDMYIVGSMCALLIGSALWGEQFAHETARLSVALSVFFFVLCWFQVAYVPLPADSMHETFSLVLSRMPAVTLFSIVAHYCAQLCTLALSSIVRAVMRGWVLALGLGGAMLVGQCVDGVLFFGGTFGFATPMHTVLQMVVVSVALKLLCIIASSGLVMGALWCKERGYVQ